METTIVYKRSSVCICKIVTRGTVKRKPMGLFELRKRIKILLQGIKDRKSIKSQTNQKETTVLPKKKKNKRER